jgi:aminoacrylate hydrolase
MALDYAPLVRSVVLASSFARMDSFMLREFALRRMLLAEADPRTIYNAYAPFLFSPAYASHNPERIAAWIDRTASHPFDRDIALQRTDMIMAYDEVARLGGIRQPTLAVCGNQDFCTPPHLSEEIARGIAGCELVVLPGGGHFVHDEQPGLYFDTLRGFIARH